MRIARVTDSRVNLVVLLLGSHDIGWLRNLDKRMVRMLLSRNPIDRKEYQLPCASQAYQSLKYSRETSSANIKVRASSALVPNSQNSRIAQIARSIVHGTSIKRGIMSRRERLRGHLLRTRSRYCFASLVDIDLSWRDDPGEFVRSVAVFRSLL